MIFETCSTHIADVSPTKNANDGENKQRRWLDGKDGRTTDKEDECKAHHTDWL